MNPAKTLTPTALLLRREIVASPGTLFTRTRPYRDLNPAKTLTPTVDPRGDAAHLVARLREQAPTRADALLARVVDSLPPFALEDLGVAPDALLTALRASEAARPVYA